MICYNIGIEVHPTFSEPTKAVVSDVKRKLKWRFPWRINMLAKPRYHISKYTPPLPQQYKVFGPVHPDLEFRSDHLSRPPIRLLNVNKRLYSDRGPKYVKTITKTLAKSWDGVYNYYRKKLRQKRLKKLRRLKAKKKLKQLSKKKPTKKELELIEQKKKERWDKLCKPKPRFMPPKIKKKWKPLEELARNVDRLAMPKEYNIVPPLELGAVNPAALTYQMTDVVRRLYQLPYWRKHPPDDYVMGKVSYAALHYQCTPRIDKLAQPSFSARAAKKQDEDKYDPWAISPKALKYKASARILELAKPLERD